jgi:hypothetical protein
MERSIDKEASRRIVLGLNHEQQHQELVLTDIKHAFFSNPLHPSYEKGVLDGRSSHTIPELRWHSVQGGLIEIGYSVNAEDPMNFCFDNETPRHKTYLEPFQIANRSVTCREYLEFMSDDAYTRPELWLSDGWEAVKLAGWDAPLYWERDPGDETGWDVFTLKGWHGLPSLLDTPCATSASLKPTPLHAGVVADFRQRRSGSLLRVRNRGVGIYWIWGGCIQ